MRLAEKIARLRVFAEQRYERFARALRELGVRVETGDFEARMSVEPVNDGPVTIVLESGRFWYPAPNISVGSRWARGAHFC